MMFNSIKYILFTLLLVAALLTVMYITPRGTSTSPDGIHYLAASRSLVEGKGFLRFTGEPFLRWPPLYPVLLAGMGLFSDAINISILQTTAVFNALSYAGLIIVSTHLIWQFSKKRWIALIGIIAVFCGYPILLMTFFSLSEPLFNTFVVIFLAVLIHFLQQENWKWLIILAIVAALSALQRYAGIAILMFGFAVILIFLNRATFWQRFRYGFVFGLISSTPLALWFLNNYRLTGSFSSGHLAPTLNVSARQVFGQMFFVVIEWFIPASQLQIGYFDVAIFVFTILSLFAIYIGYKKFDIRDMLTQFGKHYLLILSSLFILIYFLLIFILNVLNTQISIEDRTMAPLYVPFVFVIIEILNLLVDKAKPFGYRNVLLGLLSLVWVFYPVSRFVKQVQDFSSNDYNPYYNAAFLDTLDNDLENAEIYTNYPMLVLKHNWRWVHHLPQTLDGWDALQTSDKALYLVWINEVCVEANEQRNYCRVPQYTLTELLENYDLTSYKTFDKATIFCVFNCSE